MPDMFPCAIAMLTQCWGGMMEKQLEAFRQMQTQIGLKLADLARITKQMRDGFDKGARDFLKQSQLPRRPTIEELKAARDSGPEALAKLLAARTPTMLADVASDAVREGLETFVVALLAEGLDPAAMNHHGKTVLSEGEKLGPESPIYRLLKSTAESKR